MLNFWAYIQFVCTNKKYEEKNNHEIISKRSQLIRPDCLFNAYLLSSICNYIEQFKNLIFLLAFYSISIRFCNRSTSYKFASNFKWNTLNSQFIAFIQTV